MKPRNTNKHTGRNNATKAPALYDMPTLTIKTSDGERIISLSELNRLLESETPFAVCPCCWKEIERTYWLLSEIVEGRDLYEWNDSETANQNN